MNWKISITALRLKIGLSKKYKMKAYQTKIQKLSGSDLHEVRNKAYIFYLKVKGKTKRRPFIRSAYFKKEKVFLSLFWAHLFKAQNWRDRVRRLKFFPCAIDLIINSRFEPTSKENPNHKSEIFHRFAGITKEKELFFVQIKEDKKTSQKWLISIFPLDK